MCKIWYNTRKAQNAFLGEIRSANSENMRKAKININYRLTTANLRLRRNWAECKKGNRNRWNNMRLRVVIR